MGSGRQPASYAAGRTDVKDRSLPVSDVFSHHRILTTCHLSNIAMRLGRKLTFDFEKEKFVHDDEANRRLQARPMRAPWRL